jgi:superfamily II DNA or RNA helicase
MTERHLVALAKEPPAPELAPSEAATRAVDGVLADLGGGHRGVVVDSPPGAGKSTLVVRAAAHLAEAGERLMIVAQTNEQVDDLIERIAEKHPLLSLGRLSESGYGPSERVLERAAVRVEE